MKRLDANLLIGGLIVILGSMVLLHNLGLFGPIEALFWIVLFALGGAAFIGITVQNKTHWWASIPAMALLSVAALMSVSEMAPRVAERWGGTLFLGGVSLGFWAIVLRKHEAWWAIIPAGLIATLALVAGLAPGYASAYAGALLFGGIALTFGLVYLVRRSAGHALWALIIAGGALLLGVATLSVSATFFGVLWPVLTIVGGVALLMRALRHSTQGKEVRYDNPTLPQSH